MKTKESVQKKILKVIACTISLLLLSINLQAQKFLQSGLNTNSDPMLVAIFYDNETKPESIKTGVSTKANEWTILLENETEESLDLESWMLSENVFEVRYFKTEVEESLDLEEWMKNENHFKNQKAIVRLENERKMEIENWMTSIKIWN